jgi:uncharacterized protein (DUF2225 family)
MNNKPEPKVSFLAKETLTCPVCGKQFHKEELMAGGGRLIAGELTDELHRLYEPSSKYGRLYPLAYIATVCPACWFASSAEDFNALPTSNRATAAADEFDRKQSVAAIFPSVDFDEPRTLLSGTVSQYLVLHCYDYYPHESSPMVKQALTALRTGWLLEHLDETDPGQHWDWLSKLFKRKASFLCRAAQQAELKGVEKLSDLNNFGPDTDKNYGYEGFLYVSGVLEVKYGDKDNEDIRNKALMSIKISLGKIFGLGKSTKAKPGPLLEKAKNLYREIADELQEADEE